MSILTFSLGIRGSYIPDRWTAQLNRLGLMSARVEKPMEGIVSQALKELTAIYGTRYAAIQHTQRKQDKSRVCVLDTATTEAVAGSYSLDHVLVAVPVDIALAAVATACAVVAAALLPLLLYLPLLPPSVLLSPWLSLLLLSLPSLPLLLLLPLQLSPSPLLLRPLPVLSQYLLLWLRLLPQQLLLPQQWSPPMEPLDLPGSSFARHSQERQGGETLALLGQGLQDVLHRLAH